MTYIRVYTEADAELLCNFLHSVDAVSEAWWQPASEDAQVNIDEGYVVSWSL